MSVKIVRLTSGEELIGTLNGNKLSDVAILIPTQQNSLGLAPFMAYAEFKYLELNEKDVMFTVDPVADLKAQYDNMFNKILTPNQKIIT